jgi:molybdenum cofactor synthesis domain-containing protein
MFKRLHSLNEAKQIIAESASPKPLGAETVLLTKAVGRVLAEDLISPIEVPPFDRSTVDGYAVIDEDTFPAEENKPVKLQLTGKADVGAVLTSTLKKGSAIEIVTGAPLPAGSNAVVMIEDTMKEAGEILVYRTVARGGNVMRRGSDIRRNDTVLSCGTILSSRELGVIAALGFPSVRVFKKPKVAVISTGAEIVAPGEPLLPGQIFDINTFTLIAAVTELGGTPVCFGNVADDDVESLKLTLEEALIKTDLVITSGGVSVGPKDYVPSIIDTLGKPGLLVHGVAVKPGKPVAVALIGKKLIFSLPGNPTSSLMMFHLLVNPFLSKLAGTTERILSTVRALTTRKLFAARGRQTFIPVTISKNECDQLVASPAATGQSGAITTLAHADGYIALDRNEQFVEAGKEVTVFLFKDLWT